MKKPQTKFLGNGLIVIGLTLCLASLVGTIASQAPGIIMATYWTSLAMIGIFSGAFIWLLGVQLSGHENICDKYYLLKLLKRH